MVVRETVCQFLARVFMRAAWHLENTAYGNLYLCSVLKDGIDGAKKIMVQRGRERAVQMRIGEDLVDYTEADKEEGANKDELGVEVDRTEDEAA